MDGLKLTSVRRRALYNDILEFLIQKLNNSNLILLKNSSWPKISYFKVKR